MKKLPEQFLDLMKIHFNNEFSAFVESFEMESSTSIRYNPNKYNISDKKNLFENSQEIPWAKNAFYLDSRPKFILDPMFHAGAYYVQEASSMIIEQVFDQHIPSRENLTILDLCAAPGGKSSHILSLIDNSSILVANELVKLRNSILQENLIKWGNDNIIVSQADTYKFKNLTQIFDVILIDAPCSGEGMMRKDDTAIQEWSMENVKQCAARQKNIFDDVIASLKDGGVLIYSTCTFNEAENEDNSDYLIEKYDLEVLVLELKEEWGISQSHKGNKYGYHFYPHKSKGEGFYINIFRKKNQADVNEIDEFDQNDDEELAYKNLAKTRLPSTKYRANRDAILQKSKEKEFVLDNKIKNYILNPENYTFYNLENRIFALNSDFDQLYKILKKNFQITHFGVEIGEIFGKKFKFAQSLAMSNVCNLEKFESVELNLVEALQYLRRENFDLDCNEGWLLLKYNSIVLGWVNKIQNRFNNYYPKEWRIKHL